MNTTRQSKTWPYDLVKGIVLLILLGLMLYSRPDMSAQIQRQLGLPFGTVTVLDAPQVTGTSAMTLSGHTQSGALVEVFAGEASLGTTTARPDGSWSLPVTLPTGTYQLRAQARDAAGAALGSAAVLEWSGDQQVAGAAAAAPTPAGTAQEAAAGTQAAGDTNTEADTEGGTDAAVGTTADSGAAAGTDAAPATESGGDTAASGAPDAAGDAAQAPAMAPPEIGVDGVIFTGIGEPGTTIEVVGATGTVGTADVSPDGSWTLNVRLAPGKYELQARATDASGTAAGNSPVVAVTVPAAAGPDGETEGVAAAAPFTASGTEKGANAGANTGSQSAGAASSAAAQGSLGAAQVADGAANLSGLGTPGTTVEIVAAPAAGAGGTAGAVAVTSSAGNKSAEIEGTGSSGTATENAATENAAGSDTATKVVLGSVVVAADGTWQLTAKINPGEYTLAVRTLDADGAIIDESDSVSLSVPKAAAPVVTASTTVTDSVPVTESTTSAASTGVTTTATTAAATTATTAATASVTSGAAPQVSAPVVGGDKVTLTGTAAPGAAVELVTNDEVLGEAVADADGLWIVAVQLDPGSYALRIRTVSTADKGIQYSRVVSLTVPAADSTIVAAGDTITSSAAAVATTTLPTPATKATAAVTSTTLSTAAVATETTTATTTTTTVTATTPMTAAAATIVSSGAAKTPAVTPAIAAQPGTATAAAAAASSAVLTTTSAAGAAAAGTPAASAAAPGAPPTLSQPEISGNTLTLSGTGIPGTSVEIVSGTTVLGKATVGADGTWSLASEVKPGSYKFQVVRRDASGKVISQSPVVSLDIPAAAAAPAPTADATATATAEPTVEAAAAAEPASAGGDSDGSGGQAHVVEPGDTLTSLALEYLGSERRYPEIVAATNIMAKQDPAYKQITDPNLIVVGQQLWIPAP